MHGVASRQLSIPQNNLLRTLHHGFVNRQHLIYYTEQCVKSRLNCVAAIDGDIPVQDFLQNLGIGNRTLTVGDQFLKSSNNVYDYNLYYGVAPADDPHALTGDPMLQKPGHAGIGRQTLAGLRCKVTLPQSTQRRISKAMAARISSELQFPNVDLLIAERRN